MTIKSNFKSSAKHKKQMAEVEKTLLILEASKLTVFYALRNQGWGAKRLSELNEKWNGYLNDIDNGLFSLSDIEAVLMEEVGIGRDDLKLRPEVL